MVYSFNPVRFAGIVFGLSLAGAALAALLRAALGIDPAAGVIAALPLIVAMALEARRFGQALTAPPDNAACWRLAGQTAGVGAATYLALLVIGSLLARGAAAMSEPALWLRPLGMVAAVALCAFVTGFFLIRALASARVERSRMTGHWLARWRTRRSADFGARP